MTVLSFGDNGRVEVLASNTYYSGRGWIAGATVGIEGYPDG
jgi:hypothetical protein